MRVIPLKIENETEAKRFMADLGVSPEGVKILSSKSVYASFKIEGIKSWEANIIKQHLLSLGTDAAIERNALVKDIKTSVLIFGSLSQLEKFCAKLKNQPFSLKEVSEKISFYLSNLSKEEFKFLARDKVLKIKTPVVCGVINITDDSFSGDGILSKAADSKFRVEKLVLNKAENMVKAGAKILDIGGESSRPGSLPINEKEEINRVVPALKALRKNFKNTLISVDTYKYNVAKEALSRGADIINDITALRKNPKIAPLIKKYKAGCVLMHMQGNPWDMQKNPRYKDVVGEQIDFFKERLEFCSKQGIAENQVLIDPGIGFGKRLEDNIKIINELYKFKILACLFF